MKKIRITHRDRILKYLQDNGSITSWEAIKEFGITRLSAVIFNLRKEDYDIETTYETNKNRYGDKVTYAKYLYKDYKLPEWAEKKEIKL